MLLILLSCTLQDVYIHDPSLYIYQSHGGSTEENADMMYHEAELQFSGILKIITGLASLADYQHGIVHNSYIATANQHI